jgi:hypothetical protein
MGNFGWPTKSPFTSCSYKTGLDEAICESLTKRWKLFQVSLQYISWSFKRKLKGFFVASDIRKLISDETYETAVWNVEREAWIALKDVISKFLRNYRD